MLFALLFICAACVLARDTPIPADSTPKIRKAQTEDGPVTVTPSGTIKGSWMTSRGGRQFQAYRGIRYAEPPVGELRFRPPKPILRYGKEVDASTDGPACPQITPPDYYVDEDCLTINVYTPDNNSSKTLPVIVFIHPGGFYSFSGRSDVAGPHYLLDKDIVLVTFNYRLGTLGFLSTGDELAPGNNGMKDQVAALKWVRRNIRAFGGNPSLVTLAGYSAGSISVMLHMISPISEGLFHRGISMSGSPTTKEPLSHDQYNLALRQAQILGCPTDAVNSSVIVDCLKTKPWRDMGESLLGFFEFGFDPVTLWAPVVEKDFGQERFLTRQPVAAIRERRMHAVPNMISLTTNEFFWKAFTILRNETLLNEMNENWDSVAPISFQLPRDQNATAPQRLKEVYLDGKELVNNTDTAEKLGKLYGDAITGFHTHRMANLMCRHSPYKVFYSEFAYIGNHSHYEDPITRKPTGAAHHDDLIYLFSLSYRFPMIPVDDSMDSQLVDRMTALWYNFARYGDPNPRDSSQPELSSLEWPPMTPARRRYLRVGDHFSLTSGLRGLKPFKLAINWWKEPDMGVPAGEREGCAAARMWRAACSTLCAPDSDEAWKQIVESSPPDSLWHSLRNCVAYQAGVWQNLLLKGIDDVVQPAAFKLAIVLRHTPSELIVGLLAEMLRLHPQSQDLTSYVLALLTDDEAQWCGNCGAGESSGGSSPTAPPGPAPMRDLLLFGDCELAVLAASREEYDAHAKLVRAEYSKLSHKHYFELRIKILEQLTHIPKLYHTPEFECFEAAARENIEREISTLREQLLTDRTD